MIKKKNNIQEKRSRVAIVRNCIYFQLKGQKLFTISIEFKDNVGTIRFKNVKNVVPLRRLLQSFRVQDILEI